MRYTQFVYLSMTLFLLGAGCSKSDPAPSYSNSFETQNLDEAQQLAAEAQAHCSDPSQCSPSVGMLIGTTDTSAYQCTAFLVASDIVATNSHCIPDDLKTAGSSCADRISLVFPDVGAYAGVKTGCSQVLSASSIDSSNSHADYAFLRLNAPVSRPAYKLDRTGLSDNGTYTVYKMDPYQGNGIPEGYLREAQCKAVFGTFLAKQGTSSQAEVQSIADCTIIHGNSGSPMVDSTGNVPAIVFATLEDDDKSQLESSFEAKGISFSDPSIAEMGLATNYSCLSLPVDAGALPAACASAANAQNNAPNDAEIEAQMKTELAQRLKTGASQLDPSIDWTLAVVPGKAIDVIGLITDSAASVLAMTVPKCVLDEKTFLKPEKKSLLGSYDSSSMRDLKILVWSFGATLNRYLQLKFALTEEPANMENLMILQYDPQSLSSEGKSAMAVSDAIDLEQNTPLFNGLLAPCPKASQHQ